MKAELFREISGRRFLLNELGEPHFFIPFIQGKYDSTRHIQI